MCSIVVRVLALLVCVAAFTAAPAFGAEIIWVDEAAPQGLDGWQDLLEGAGHTVTRMSYVTELDAGVIDTLNQADLVIFSRDANSGNYAQGEEPLQWNSLTVPLIQTNAYLIRSSRWQWVNNTVCPDIGPATQMVIAGDHPIFNDVGSVGDEIAMLTSATALTGATGAGNGEVLATDTNGRMWIVLWEDASVPFYTGTTMKPAAPRMWFGAAFGPSTAGGDPLLGSMNLTEEGQAIFLNAVAYLTGALHRVKAHALQPNDGVFVEETAVTLSWKAGDFAVSHEVYIGTDFDDVEDRNVEAWSTTDTTLSAGQAGGPYPDGLVPGQTYYWCVDEIDASHPDSPWKGAVRSFSLPPRTAWDPSPADGGPYIRTDQVLTWQSGMKALLHVVYFSESFDEVNEPPTTGSLIRDAVYDPGVLNTATTYYWRVDEFTETETVEGDIWSFTTVPEVAVADDPNLTVWLTLGEGTGTTAVDWSGHGHHGTVNGDAQWIDGGLSFDGADDFVSALLPVSETAYTITLWFKTTDPQAGIYGVVAQDLGNDTDRTVFLTGGELNARVYTASGNMIVTTAGLNLADGCWHHMVHTFDATLGEQKLYVDGVEQASGAVEASAFDWDKGVSVGWSKHGSHRYFTGMMEEVRLYNKMLSEAEVQQVMRGDPTLAGNPEPARSATVDIRDVAALRWNAGDGAVSHDVYFGANRDAVALADKDAAEYQGSQAGTSFSVAGVVEFGGGDYYWRIDEVAADATVIAGDVWKFTVPDYLVVDDFESYTNEVGARVFETWLDGVGFTLPEPGNAGNGTGAMVGHDIWSAESPYFEGALMETADVHGGGKAMPVYYDNTFSPYYSEVECTFTPSENWTVEGVTTLVVWFRGEAENTGQLYAKINGTKVPYAGDAADFAGTAWTAWNIDLASVGVSLTNVTMLTVGVEGGDAGVLYVDDVRLTKP